MINRLHVLGFLLFTLVSADALAQQEDTKTGDEAVSQDATEPVAPYDPKLLRFAEVLGSLHYLRALCGANEGPKWRDAMNDLLISEEPTPKRRARLVSRFNRGYRSLNQVYSTCTDSALLASDRYKKEGVLLASQITSRYGR